jgi:hypothetical protein
MIEYGIKTHNNRRIMIEPSIAIPLILGLPTFTAIVFFLGVNIGGHNGMSVGKDAGIVYCMEKPKECKISYDYLKLQENSK